MVLVLQGPPWSPGKGQAPQNPAGKRTWVVQHPRDKLGTVRGGMWGGSSS